MRRSVFAGLCAALVVAFGVVGHCGLASANTVLYDNLPPSATSGGADFVNTFNPNTPDTWGPLADSFSTGSDPLWLADVKLLLSGDSTQAGSITVRLLSDNPTYPFPGSRMLTIGTLSDSLLSLTPSVIDFPVSPGFSLTPNTRYWIEVSSTDSSTAEWSYATDGSGLGVANEYNYSLGSNPNSNGGVSPNSNAGPYQMEVNANSVPEPSALIVWSGLCAMGLIAAWRRRRRQSA